MNTEHVDFLVEEPSMEMLLRSVLPKLVGEVEFSLYSSQCKEELLAELPKRLRGYANWRRDGLCIVVLVDQDDDDCAVLKGELERIARQCGLRTRSADRECFCVVNRIVVEELEAWYFGDWDAVCAAYPGVSPSVPSKAQYRDPDHIAGGTKEAFERLLQKAGYYRTGLRQIEVARKIGTYFDPVRNRSRSFRSLRDVIQEITN